MKMIEVLVEHEYVAQEPDELTIRRGDVIREVECQTGGWWTGTLHNRRGIFPDNFVRVVDTAIPTSVTTGVTLRSRSDLGHRRKCRAVFSYRAVHEDELSLEVDDIVQILGEEEEGWWRGKLHGREGVFPSNFVEEAASRKSNKSGSRESLNSLDDVLPKSPALPPKPERNLFEVRYAYQAENDDELSLTEGDIITLVSKDGQDPGWWRGQLHGRVGVFPDNFVVPAQPHHYNNHQHHVMADGMTTSMTSIHTDDGASKKLPPVAFVKPTLDDHNTTATHGSNASGTPLPVNIKPSHIVQQRKSFDIKAPGDNGTQVVTGGACADQHSRVTPPAVPGKKPSVPIKKSPSGTSLPGSVAGVISGIRKKIVDAVDGSKQSSIAKDKDGHSMVVSSMANDDQVMHGFDQVERSSMLQDVRATRAKAPRRRPPSTLVKDGIMPGDLNHMNGDATVLSGGQAADSAAQELSTSSHSNSSSVGIEGGAPDSPMALEVKPRVREWERHRAPWLEEMKQNQAKRTSTSPDNHPHPPQQHQHKPPKPRSTINTAETVEEHADTKVQVRVKEPPVSPIRHSKEIPASVAPPVLPTVPPPTSAPPSPATDMSKSMPLTGAGALKMTTSTSGNTTTSSSITTSLEMGTSPPTVQIRHSPKSTMSPITAAVRHSMPPVVNDKPTKLTASTPVSSRVHHQPQQHQRTTPVAGEQMSALTSSENSTAASGDSAFASMPAAAVYAELIERIVRLERESQMNRTAIEDLRGKLQVETDMRRLLQAELDRVSQQVMQV